MHTVETSQAWLDSILGHRGRPSAASRLILLDQNHDHCSHVSYLSAIHYPWQDHPGTWSVLQTFEAKLVRLSISSLSFHGFDTSPISLLDAYVHDRSCISLPSTRPRHFPLRRCTVLVLQAVGGAKASFAFQAGNDPTPGSYIMLAGIFLKMGEHARLTSPPKLHLTSLPLFCTIPATEPPRAAS